MAYTFISASYAAPDNQSAIAITREAASVVLSESDTPSDWADLLAWGTGNVIAPHSPPTVDFNAMDTLELNRALAENGSVVRALAEVIFAEINKLRIKTGDPAYTKQQFVTALKAQMRSA